MPHPSNIARTTMTGNLKSASYLGYCMIHCTTIRVFYLGKNATESFEDVGHSPDAREQQTKYLIGEISTPSGKKVDVRG